MRLKDDWKKILVILASICFFYFMPINSDVLKNAVLQSITLLNWYAREHVILCLIPAMFIAGAIGVFMKSESVLRYLGPTSNKITAYAVASISGGVLAVCSCTVLPLFAGIYTAGAGIGPACAFLYSGPAINILAITLSTKVLGADIGFARTVGAILFSLVIGLIMELIFRGETRPVAKQKVAMLTSNSLSMRGRVVIFGSLVALLVFANFATDANSIVVFRAIAWAKWYLSLASGLTLYIALWYFLHVKIGKLLVSAIAVSAVGVATLGNVSAIFAAATVSLAWILNTTTDETREWLDTSWGFFAQILPLLFGGIIVSGFTLGAPGGSGIIPKELIYTAVAGNSLTANFAASLIGAFMYFATLTEIPIISALIENGMGKGPALALLLSGPALSLPSMLVIRAVMGTKKALTFITLVVLMATLTGVLFGLIVD